MSRCGTALRYATGGSYCHLQGFALRRVHRCRVVGTRSSLIFLLGADYQVTGWAESDAIECGWVLLDRRFRHGRTRHSPRYTTTSSPTRSHCPITRSPTTTNNIIDPRPTLSGNINHTSIARTSPKREGRIHSFFHRYPTSSIRCSGNGNGARYGSNCNCIKYG